MGSFFDLGFLNLNDFLNLINHYLLNINLIDSNLNLNHDHKLLLLLQRGVFELDLSLAISDLVAIGDLSL